MQLVKIFFKEPDYYIHGTDNLDSIGTSSSHGCLRLDPVDAAARIAAIRETVEETGIVVETDPADLVPFARWLPVHEEVVRPGQKRTQCLLPVDPL